MRTATLRSPSVVLWVILLVIAAAPSPAAAVTLPPNFREDTVFAGLTQPTAVSFARDGRVFVAEKGGLIKVFAGLSDTSPEVVADLRSSVHDFWDRGMLAMVLDPNFPTKNVIYVLYTYDAPVGGMAPTHGDACADPTGNGCVVSGRLSRVVLGSSPPQFSEQVLINDWCAQFPSHSIGSLAFGADGALYASGGDGASFTHVDYGQTGSPVNPCGDPPGGVGGAMTPPTAEGGALRSQDLRTPSDPTSLDGTVIRINPDTGAGLPDNPLAGSGDPNARRIVAHGLRNPFRMTFRPGTNEVWLGDVGWNDWEEINRIADVKGSVENFGWPCYEGNRTGSARQAGYDSANLNVCENLYSQANAVVAPFLSYRHREGVITNESCPLGGSSVTGVAFQFYTGGPYPPEYDGALFFSDYSRNCIWVVQRSRGKLHRPSNIKSFVGGAASPVQLTMYPGGELFYADLSGGTIRRIRYVAPLPGDQDKALNKPATASSTEYAGLEPGLAVDGNASTRWSSSWADGQWWQVDLGSARQVDRVRANWETAFASRYRISTSTDGSTFTTAAEVPITQAGVEITSFSARPARYVRITGLTRGTPWGVSLWDVNVYGPADAANRAPTATASASPTSGEPPLAVAFDGSASSDPDGDALGYAWDLDGDGAFDDSTASRPNFTYTTTGTYRVSLEVSDGKGGTDTDTVTIGVGLPKPTITSPTTSSRWAVGSTVSFAGSAVDNRGQAIPAPGLTWTVSLHHGACPECHEHQVQTFTGTAGGSFAAPDHEYPSELELRLTATDANGLKGTTSLRVPPSTTALTLASAPTGLTLGLNGTSATTPFTRTVITGSSNTISAPSPQSSNGTWTFSSWSDAGAATHLITAPAASTTYTATFTQGQAQEDKTLNRTATASSREAPQYVAPRANDGNSTTRWSSAARDNQWWQVDLGRVRQVDRWSSTGRPPMHPATASASPTTAQPSPG